MIYGLVPFFFSFFLGHLSIFVLFLFLGLLFLGMVTLVVVIVKDRVKP